MTLLKERIGQCDFRCTSKNELENTDVAVTELLNYSRRKAEVQKRHLSHSKEKILEIKEEKLLNQTEN